MPIEGYHVYAIHVIRGDPSFATITAVTESPLPTRRSLSASQPRAGEHQYTLTMPLPAEEQAYRDAVAELKAMWPKLKFEEV